MSRFTIIHVRPDKWARVDNHMDARHCPYCGATVHGKRGQGEHLAFHKRAWEDESELEVLLGELRKRTGMAEEDVEVAGRWSAAVEGFDAIEGPGGAIEA